MHGLLVLLAVAIASVAALHVLGPIGVHSSQRVPREPDVQVVNPNDPALPAGLEDALRARIEELRPLGFAPVTTIRYAGSGPVTIYGTLLRNDAARDTAFALGAYVTRPGAAPRLRSRSLEFASRFGEEMVVSTTNSAVVPVFARVPWKHTHRFPMVPEAARLYRVHQAVSEPFGAHAKTTRVMVDPLDLFRTTIVREMEGQVAAGYFRLDEAAAAYRPTWKGACLMRWRLLWPWKQVRRALHERRARGLLREIGEAC
jgi:hypothetical protein